MAKTKQTKSEQVFEELTKLRDEYQKAIQEKGSKILTALFKDFFEEHPEVQAVRWCQYVPGFNDGDPCEFTVGDLRVQLQAPSKEDEEEDFDEDSFLDDYEVKGNAPLKGTMQEISSTLSEHEDVLESLYGSNAEVTFKRDGQVVIDSDYDCGY